MSLPSHIVAPLIGCATTCAAVFAMGSVVSPLLQGPQPTGRSLSGGSETVTLSPAMRERAPLALPRAGAGDDDTVEAGFLAAALPGLPVSGGTVTLPAVGGPTIPTAAPAGDDLRETRAPTGPGDNLAREEGGLAGGGSSVAARPGDPPIGPALAAPGTAVVDLPSGPATPEVGPRRFTLRVVGVDRTNDQIRVRVSIDPGPNSPASTVTIALKPPAASTKEGQAVKVSLDVVTGEGDIDPKLRVRIAVIEDTTGGETTATEGGDSGSSNVLDISVPMTPGDDDTGETPGDPTDPTPEAPTSELLLDLGGTTSSEGSAIAPAAPAEEGTEAPTVTVEVSVTPDPEPALEPAPSAPVATETPTPPATDTPAEPSVAEATPEPVASSDPEAAPAPQPAPAAPADTQEPAPAPAEPTPVPEPAPEPVTPPAEPVAPAPEPVEPVVAPPVDPAPAPAPAAP